MTAFEFGGSERELIRAEDFARDKVSQLDLASGVPGLWHVVEVDTEAHALVREEEGASSAVFVVDEAGYDELMLEDRWAHVEVLSTVGWTAEELLEAFKEES